MAKRKKRKKRARSRLLLLILIAGGGVFAWWKFSYPIRGIDVSHYQEEINWKKVAESGQRFAFIKATEGASMKDEYFEANWTAAQKAGIVRGAYHFFIPSVDAKTQAENFLKTVDLKPGDLPPVLDLEETSRQSAAKIREGTRIWLETVEQATGVRPILYTMPKFAEDYLDASFGKYPLWLVRLHWFWWEAPDFWDDWTFWQHNHHGKCPGIAGDVDLNYFKGSESAFQDLRIP